MQSPYSSNPLDAFMAAQTSAALAISALVVFRPTRSTLSRVLLLLATFVAVCAPTAADLVRGLGHPFGEPEFNHALELSAALATAAMAFSSPRWLVLVALFGEFVLFRGTHYLVDQHLEVSALHLAWIGALIGFEALADTKPERPAAYPHTRSHLVTDLVLGATATLTASVVALVVLQGACDSADEWAYTYQAAVFAKLHAWSAAPPCYPVFQSFWVFEKGGHVFSQYLPGWPLFMTPFVMAHLAWLAGPVSLGILVVGIARLARRAAAASIEVSAVGAERQVQLAGTIAALSATLADTVLINGASRFPHIWVCAMFAWSTEAICVLTSPGLDARRQVRWGVTLGCALAWLLSTRHVDGCLLGVGLFLYVMSVFVRGRLGPRAILATAIPFTLFGGFTLVILRLQLGTWFTTGYSLTSVIHTWNKVTISLPKPNEWRWGFPIGVGAYCWWPLAPAIGLAGMIALCRTRERRVAFMLCLGTFVSLAFYASLELGRGFEFGYGPRYQLIVIVPMAVGTGVMFAPVFASALARVSNATPLFVGGPAAIALVAALLGVIRIAPLVYPVNLEDVKARNVLFEAIKKAHVTNGIVWIQKGMTISDWLDLTQNLPPDLYDDDVLILMNQGPELRQCVREHWPQRRWFRAQAGREITIAPE